VDDDLNAVMAAKASEAIDLIEQVLGYSPDFSPDGIASAEAVAAKFHTALPPELLQAERERDPSEEEADPQLAALCLTLGGFVGEVIRRQIGGQWVLEEPEPGVPPTEILQVLPRLWLNPIGWVSGRIVVGSVHNIFATYQRCTREENLAPYRD
jgi:hypothetical protein